MDASLTLAELAIVIALLLVAGAAGSLTLRTWLRRRERRDEAAAVATPGNGRRGRWWISRSVLDCAPPLALLIWLHVLFAVLMLVAREVPSGWQDAAASGLEWAYGFGIVAALFWLLTRIGLIGEALLLAASRDASTSWDTVIWPVAGKAVRRLLPLMALGAGVSMLPLTPALARTAHQMTALVLIDIVDDG